MWVYQFSIYIYLYIWLMFRRLNGEAYNVPLTRVDGSNMTLITVGSVPNTTSLLQGIMSHQSSASIIFWSRKSTKIWAAWSQLQILYSRCVSVFYNKNLIKRPATFFWLKLLNKLFQLGRGRLILNFLSKYYNKMIDCGLLKEPPLKLTANFVNIYSLVK